MLVIVWLGAPAVLAAVLTALTPHRSRRVVPLLLVGVALGVALFVFAYLNAPPDFQHSQGDSDGELFWGRWWEPGFTLFAILFAYVSWALGIVVAVAADLVLKGDRPRAA